jgi:hypothetical protein
MGGPDAYPAIALGPGRVVLTTVNHLNCDVYELTVAASDGRTETVWPTGLHKFYRPQDGEWVSAQDLRTGDELEGAQGRIHVQSLAMLPGTHRVYNMTVEADHTYRVSLLGVLVHNNGCAERLPFGMRDRGRGLGQQQGREFRPDQLQIHEFDPNQRKHVRGWLKNERRRIENSEVPRETRVPPGYELGHGRTTPAREGFDYSNSRLQGIDLNRLEESVRRRFGGE